MLAVYKECLDIAGTENNKCRIAIEEVSKEIGLGFVVNVIIDKNKKIVKCVSGDPILAQRRGIVYSRQVYEQEINAKVDTVIVDARPAEIDYWQGIKALAHAQRAVKENGIVILVGEFPRGISLEHPEMEKYCNRTYQELEKLLEKGIIVDLVNAGSLFIHALIMERCQVISVSSGLDKLQKNKLGFTEAQDINEALNIAKKRMKNNGKYGLIDYGADVLPKLSDLAES
jgi:nickel-dependent lactate racemase